jgi:hypothetical protein
MLRFLCSNNFLLLLSCALVNKRSSLLLFVVCSVANPETEPQHFGVAGHGEMAPAPAQATLFNN